MRIGQFCGRVCSDNAENAAPKVLEVPEGHVTFKSGTWASAAATMQILTADSGTVADQFTSTWKAGKPCPAVRRIYKIVMTKALMRRYETYK